MAWEVQAPVLPTVRLLSHGLEHTVWITNRGPAHHLIRPEGVADRDRLAFRSKNQAQPLAHSMPPFRQLRPWPASPRSLTPWISPIGLEAQAPSESRSLVSSSLLPSVSRTLLRSHAPVTLDRSTTAPLVAGSRGAGGTYEPRHARGAQPLAHQRCLHPARLERPMNLSGREVMDR